MSEVNIESKKISELPNKEKLSDNDLFIFERTDEDGNKKSYKISYSQIKDYVTDNLVKILNAKSMSYCDADDYAKFTHGHDYSDFFFFPTYGPQSRNPDYMTMESCYCIGKFDIRTYDQGYYNYTDHEMSVCIPKDLTDLSEIEKFNEERKIGELKFLGIQNFNTYITEVLKQKIKTYPDGTSNIDIDDNNFLGYVVPNGTQFTCDSDEFKDACEAYGNNKTATSFTVPNFSNFLRANNNTNSSIDPDEIGLVNFHNEPSSHTHTIGQQTSESKYELTGITVDYKSTPSPGKYPSRIHTDYSINSAGYFKAISCVIDGKFSGTTTETDESLDIETHPSYINIPTLIYIGKK